jgi:hypothetical protein
MANHLTLQASQNEVHPKDHQEDTHEEEWMVANRVMRKKVTANDHEHIHQYTQDKSPETQGRKEAQGRTQKSRKK